MYHGSVFYQMAGGVGPSSVTCDELGYIYVACFDVKENSKEGKVLIYIHTYTSIFIHSCVYSNVLIHA